MIVAQFFLVFDIGIAFLRAKGRAQRLNGYINIDVLSVAFASLFFWIIPTVFLGSIIGVSQSAHSVPRILLQFSETSQEPALAPPNVLQHDRELNGGIYSWQSTKRSHNNLESVVNTNPNIHARCFSGFRVLLRYIEHHLAPASTIIPITITSLACITGVITAWLVPPSGFECRHVGMLSIFFAWICSWLLGLFVLPSRSHPWHFSIALGKDIIFAIITLAGLALGQAGVYNRCSCYTIWGGTGIIMPGYASIRTILASRIVKEYPAIVIGAGIGIQLLLVPLFVYWNYKLAFDLFLRGDNGKDLPRAHRAVTDGSFMKHLKLLRQKKWWKLPSRIAISYSKLTWSSRARTRRDERIGGHEMPSLPPSTTSRNPSTYTAISEHV